MAVNLILNYAFAHPFQLLLTSLLSIVVVTRIVTGLRFGSKRVTISTQSSSDQEKSDANYVSGMTLPIIPYWIPWLGHTVPFALGFQNYIATLSRQYRAGAFSLVIAGKKHNMVTSPGLTKALLDGRNVPIDNHEFVFWTMEKVWDDGSAIRRMDKEILWDSLHKVLIGMMREEFVGSAIKKTTARIEEGMYNLVSGAQGWVDQSMWERAAKTEILKEKKGSSFVAEVELFELMRNFVGDIATDVLMGKDFLVNNPNVVSDLWTMDNKFAQLLLGFPIWMPGMRKATKARNDVIDAVVEHHMAYIKYLKGEDPGSKWSDLSDTTNIVVDRIKGMMLLPEEEQIPKTFGVVNAAVLWAMNVNANAVIFWMIYYLYADPVLLAEVRDEIKPFVTLQRPNSDLPVSESVKLSLDLQGLRSSCPLFFASFLETMRIEVEGTSYKQINEDFVLSETLSDAQALGRDTPKSYVFRKGEMLAMPHAAHQRDEHYWQDAKQFQPRRFWVPTSSKAEKQNEQAPLTDAASGDVKVDYRTMKVWGGGKAICKGRKFAEFEVLLFVAGFITTWDMEPLGKVRDKNGGWKHPGSVQGSGTMRPKNEVKAKIWRRKE